MISLTIGPSKGTRLAENKDQAQVLRIEHILPTLDRGEIVELDFAGVDVATQSFVHALISEAIRRHGEKAYALLQFKNCSDEVREIVLTVFEYTLTAADAAMADHDERLEPDANPT